MKRWTLLIIVIIVSILMFFILQRAGLMKTISPEELEASIEITNVETKWVKKIYIPWPQKLTLVPAISFRVKNLTDKPLRYINFNAVFRFKDDYENLGDNFWQPLGQIGDLTDTSEEDLLRHSSMFGLQPVYDQAIKRVDEAHGENCLKCGKNVVKKVETLPPEFPELPSGKLTIYYCDLEEKGCGFTVVISSDEKEGGISVFAPVVFQTDPKEIDAAQHALIDVGLTIHHSKYFDM